MANKGLKDNLIEKLNKNKFLLFANLFLFNFRSNVFNPVSSLYNAYSPARDPRNQKEWPATPPGRLQT
ncbi:hypothetical protein GCM10023143_25490 [Compostibacter hankyongensis]|uniref:Uncharacterized protein n=1 Tax=Compostibacter hankyongensis TaxID=1007089 RepID=A0ABP8G045_9BACT